MSSNQANQHSEMHSSQKYHKSDSSLNMDATITRLQNYFQKNIIKENVSKAVKKTLIRKNIIGDQEFKEQQAIEDGIKHCKNCMDKIETWTADSMLRSTPVINFEEHRQRKKQKRMKKINSIMDLVEKISTRMAEKKAQELSKEWEKQLETKKIKLADNPQLNKAMQRFKGVQERVKRTRQQLDRNEVL